MTSVTVGLERDAADMNVKKHPMQLQLFEEIFEGRSTSPTAVAREIHEANNKHKIRITETTGVGELLE